MTYQGYLFGSMSLPSGIMLIGATLIGLILFDRRAVYYASAMAGLLLVATTVASIVGWLPYAPKLHDGHFAQQPQAATFLLFSTLIVVVPAYIISVSIADYFILKFKRRTLLLQQLSERDALTQLSNRRVIYRYLSEQQTRPVNAWRQHIMIMVDIDFFKKINDRYGHIAGDAVLKYVANVLRTTAQPDDLVSRFGGEEFMVIMPTTDLGRAVAFTQVCQQRFGSYQFAAAEQTAHKLSASFGIACANQGAGSEIESLAQLIEVADQALYRAKQTGRARTVQH